MVIAKTVFRWLRESVAVLVEAMPVGEPVTDLCAEGYEIIGVVDDLEVRALFWLVSRHSNALRELQVQEELASQALALDATDADASAKQSSLRLQFRNHAMQSASLQSLFAESVKSLVVDQLPDGRFDLCLGKGWRIGYKTLPKDSFGSALLRLSVDGRWPQG